MRIWRAWNGDDPSPWLTRVIESLHPSDELHMLRLPADAGDARAQSNLLRLEYLLDFGGLWLDCDLIPLACLTNVPGAPWVAGVAGLPEGCAMCFPEPGHPFLRATLQRLELEPGELLAHAMRVARQEHKVRLEPRVLPFDAAGGALPLLGPALAVHTWSSSSYRYLHG